MRDLSLTAKGASPSADRDPAWPRRATRLPLINASNSDVELIRQRARRPKGSATITSRHNVHISGKSARGERGNHVSGLTRWAEADLEGANEVIYGR